MDRGQDLDEAALGPWLAARIDGFGALRGTRKFDTGQSNPTWALEAEGGAYVLRAKPPGKLLKSAHMVEREFRAMSALQGAGVPVPRMILLAEGADNPLGRSFFVMERLDGRIFWDPAVPEVDPAERAGIYDAMNACLAALHDVDVAAVGLGDFGKPGNYFARQTARWTEQYRASARAPAKDMLWLADWLAEHMVADDGQVALVHGDYRLDNMIFAPDAPEILGLLDWELSTLGHPLADLAYQCMQWRLPNAGGMRGLAGLDRTALGIPTEEAYVARYLDRRGQRAVDNWPFYLVFSFFRLAAILQGVVRRAEDGNASNPETAKTYASAIPALSGMAVAIAKRGA